MACYVALGDSISIDLYPEYDAKSRLGIDATGLGAASLLHRNVDRVWPAYAGRDLATRFPGLALDNRTSDGAMIDTVLDGQLAAAPDATLATLTVGGNDLLAALALASEGMPALLAEVASLKRRFTALIERVRAALPNARLAIGTIYDPTDGTGLLWPDSPRLPIELLKQMNEHIRAVARAVPNAVLADIQLHFAGHGVHAPGDERWYWEPNPIEPNARGASEVREVFWSSLAEIS